MRALPVVDMLAALRRRPGGRAPHRGVGETFGQSSRLRAGFTSLAGGH